MHGRDLLGLVETDDEDDGCQDNHAGDDEVDGAIVRVVNGGNQHRDCHEDEHAADCRHEGVERVGLAADGARRDVGHEGDGGCAVGGEREQRQHEDRHEQRQVLPGVGDGDHRDEKRRDERADHDEGRPASPLGVELVRQVAGERQHEQREDVVERHEEARCGVAKAKRVLEHQRDETVVGLPEGEGAHEGERHEDGASPVEAGQAARLLGARRLGLNCFLHVCLLLASVVW